MRTRTCFVILCALLGGGVIDAQDERPVFRVETRLVEVDVQVRDRTGAFVTDLTAGDFVILENGVPQEVSMVSMVHLPVGPFEVVASHGEYGGSKATEDTKGTER